MTLVRPLAACLPTPERVADVVTPPLGGLTVGEWMRLAEGNPYSFIHVIRTEVDTDAGGPVPGADLGPSGRQRLATMLEEGTLRRADRPAFYVYSIEDGDHIGVGVVAEVDVTDYPAGRIKRHELTRTATEELLVDHLHRVGAHSDPVALTYRADRAVAEIVSDVMSGRRPDLDFSAVRDVRQRVWVIDDAATVTALADRFDAVGALYVTDGHHRCAAAARHALGRRRANPHHRGDEDYNYVLASLFPDDQLTLLEFNRCVAIDVGDAEVGAIGEVLDVVRLSPEDDPRPQRKGQFGLIAGTASYRLTIPTDLVPEDVYASLDVVMLQRFVLGPVLGIEDPRTDPRLRYVAGGSTPVAAAHGASVCFLLHPTSVDEVMAVADAGLVMPPKSTWFEPKVWGGLFVAPLEAPVETSPGRPDDAPGGPSGDPSGGPPAAR